MRCVLILRFALTCRAAPVAAARRDAFADSPDPQIGPASNLRATSAPGTFPDEHFDFFRSAWARDNAIGTMAHWYRASAEYGRPDHGDARVSIPPLVLLAPDDAFIAGDFTRASMSFLDDGEMVELDTGTHWVIQEQPELIGRTLSEFFSRAPAS